MLSNREKLVINAICTKYIQTGSPVGSSYFKEVPYLNRYSPATLRNEMQQLEEKGFLCKMHTSSGRIPTEKGLKYYINNLLVRDNSIEKVFKSVDDIVRKNKFSKDQIVLDITKLLSSLTNTATIILENTKNLAKIIRIETIKLNNKEVLLILITDKGDTQTKKITLPKDYNFNTLKLFIDDYSKNLKNKTVEQAYNMLTNKLILKKNITKTYYDLIDEDLIKKYVIDLFNELISKLNSKDIKVDGLLNIFENDIFTSQDDIKQYLANLNQNNLYNLLINDNGLKVRFSSDIDFLPKLNYSIVSIPIKIDTNDIKTLVLVGKNNMRFEKIIPLIEYISSVLQNID